MVRRVVTRWVVLLAATAASGASAQTSLGTAITLRAGNSSSDTYVLTSSDCNVKLRVRWQYQYNVGLLCTPLKLWSTEGECGEAPGTNDVRYDDVPAVTVTTAREGAFDVAINELPGLKTGSATPCGTADLAKTHKVCGVIEYAQTSCGFTTQPKLTASSLRIIYDTLPPSPPTITGIEALDQSATVSFTVGSDATSVTAEVRAQGSATFVSGGEVVATAGRIQVTGLANGTTYDIQLRARDEAGNVSAGSNVQSVTPIKTIGFWGAYRYKGGTDQGGCGTAPGLSLPALALLTLLRRRR
ncbi:MAG: MXAN_2561 family MXYO-CTERM-anchored protein [Myxococcota bacterium]